MPGWRNLCGNCNGRDNRGIVRISAADRYFYLLQSVQAGCGTNQAVSTE